MKLITFTSLLSALLLTATFAQVPQKVPLTRYSALWVNSPFTSKPLQTGGPEIKNPLDDYTLLGIAPVPGGYRITIANKKNSQYKKVIEPGGNSEFKVVSVNRNPNETLGTTVVLTNGRIQGTVRFEPELVTPKAAPAAQQPAQNPIPGNPIPTAKPTPTDAKTPPRVPRPRVVPNNNSSRNRPNRNR